MADDQSTTHLARSWDHLGTIRQTLGNLHGSATVVNELVQNADDATNATEMRFTVTDQALEVWNNGVFAKCSDISTAECEWLASLGHRCDFHSFRLVASGDKANRADTTGAFGIGFTSVYQLTDTPELISSGEHWVIDELAPEAQRITRSDSPAGHDGTTFRLPWATTLSKFRQKVNQEAVAPDQIDGFLDVLLDAVPAAMVFVRHLRSIVVEGSDRICTFERVVDGDEVEITSSTGDPVRYLFLASNDDAAAASLKERHATVIDEKRSADVTVAIPLTPGHGNGLLYATLPTDELTHLPLHINASFIPASDRKRVRFEAAPAGDWNRRAIRAAGRAISSGLERIAHALGNQGFAEFLLQASKIGDATGDRDDEYWSIWDSIEESLPTAAVVPVHGGSFGTVVDIRLSNEEVEITASEVLASLGIRLVHSSVRNTWYELRGATGIKALHLRDVNQCLVRSGSMNSSRPATPAGLRTEEGLRRLWEVVDELISVVGRSGAQTIEDLERAWIAPGNDGELHPLADLVRAEQSTQDLFEDLDSAVVFLDETRLDGLSHLSARVPEFDLADGVSALEAVATSETPVSPEHAPAVLEWLASRARALTDSLRVRIVRLHIFPTSSGLDRLEDLALPGEFHDDLGLAKLVAIDGIKRLRPFLKDGLECPELTFSTYCSDHVAPAIRADEVDSERKQRFVRTLARRLSTVQGEPALKSTLRGLDLVLCDDGNWRKGEETYVRADVREIIGDSAAVAADDPGSNADALLNLLRWLGAQITPRAADVRERCKQLVNGGSGHVRTAAAIITHVAELHRRDEAGTSVQYGFLREMRWLPPEGHLPKGVAPSEVYSTFERHLFASQAKFLAFDLPFQQSHSTFIQWLGVQSSPTPVQVVAHLLHQSAANEPVGNGLWIYLSRNASDPALDVLEHSPCIYIEALHRYVRPERVFWGHHPFGRHRYVLGPDFAEFRPLFERLGVPEFPRPDDAKEVLLDLASERMGEPAPLLEDDVQVIHACWELLSHGMANGETTDSLFEELREAEVVLDRTQWLRQPSQVFFADSEQLASLFGPNVQARLIERHEATWRALEAAGVGGLSEVLDTRVTEQEPLPGPSRVEPLLHERRSQLVRLLSPSDDQALQKVDQFYDRYNLAPLSRLEVQQALSVDGSDEVSSVHQRRALCHHDDAIFFWVEPSDSPIAWVEISRELMRAIGIEADAASGAAVATSMIFSAGSAAEADAVLDDAGYPRIEFGARQHAAPAVADGPIGVDGDDGSEADATGESDDPAAEGEDLPTGDVSGDQREVSDDETTGQPDNDPSPSDETSDVGRSEDERDPVTYEDADDDDDSDEDVSDGGSLSDGDGEARNGKGSNGQQTGSRKPSGKSSGGKQTQLISYVNPPGKRAREVRAQSESDKRVELAGVEAVIAYETGRGRTVEVMPPNNEGFDLRSTSEDGLTRFIEVKSTASVWGKRGVRLSSSQFAMAQQERERFWLYVVEDALGAALVHPIQDPASIIDMFVFDKGWRVISQRQTDQPAPAPLPPLDLPTERTAVRGPVQVVSIDATGARHEVGWVPCSDPDRKANWFAVQVEGRSLGQPAWGGLALFSPADTVPDDDELLLLRLIGQTDPDTGTDRTIRRWSTIYNERGEAIAVRLDGDGPVPPLTVKDPATIEVLGILQRTIAAVDLAEITPGRT